MIYIAGADEWGPAVTGFRFYLLPSAALLFLPGSAPGSILMESCKLHAKPVIHKYSF